jgi:transposase
MTADNEHVTSTDASVHAATPQLRRGASSTSRAGPGTGPVTGVNGRGSSMPAVRVEGVVKRFGATVALDGAGLEVPAGMVFGLLGPNGAGKTTLVRILATLLTPDAGRAEVFGHDVAGEPAGVRELMGVPPTFRTADPLRSSPERTEIMAGKYRKFSPEFREEAARMVVETSRAIADVARELGINETSLGNWVRAYREQHAEHEPPLQVSERARLRELERLNRELEMENAFLKKAATYFAREHR